jgi:dynein heavy chain, axonemal
LCITSWHNAPSQNPEISIVIATATRGYRPPWMQLLKEVLGAISKIKSQGPVMELRYLDLAERFRTRLHTCKPEMMGLLTQEYQQSCKLQNQWDGLSDEAMRMDASLEDVKVDFSDITRKQVSDFKLKLEAFYNQFKSAGPDRGNIELSFGLKLMREVEQELASMLQMRDELVLAQKLFAMDITPYPELSNVRFHHAELAGCDAAEQFVSTSSLQTCPEPM